MGLMMSMSFAGSLIVMLYLLSKSLLKNVFTSKWRYHVLIMALFFYLVPIQAGKSFYASVLKVDWTSRQDNKIIDMSRNVIHLTPSGEFRVPAFPSNTIMLLVWGTAAGAIICYGLIIYFKQKKLIIGASEIMADNAVLCSIETIKKRLGIKRKISYRISHIIEEPLTVGIFRPILVLPHQQYNLNEADFIYEHELLHIKNYDTLFKMLGLFALGLNWYNPLVYFLFCELNIINENVCDETIVLSIEKEQKICYAGLILEMVTEKKRKPPFFAVSFSNDKKRVEERIFLIMNAKKKKKGLKFLSVCLYIMLGLAGSITVYAYEQPTILNGRNLNEIPENKYDEQINAVFVADNVTGTQIDKCAPAIAAYVTANQIKIPAETYFLDEIGNVYEAEGRYVQCGCMHTYVCGTYKEHTKSKDSCSIYIYSAEHCGKCKHTVSNGLVNRIDYAKCPHE